VVNSSRAVLYASSGTNFAAAARAVAQTTRDALHAARALGAAQSGPLEA
jgi:orotidine-5'-phosphate decarboxylase